MKCCVKTREDCTYAERLHVGNTVASVTCPAFCFLRTTMLLRAHWLSPQQRETLSVQQILQIYTTSGALI
jgi:hypothetical protein